MKGLYKTLIGVAIGGILGFGYYYFIGCKSGACPLTGNPFISTIYGAVIGLLLAGSGSARKGDREKE